MISTFDSPIGYIDPAVTEREAIVEVHRAYPHATIEPVDGYPNILGWFLFKVFDKPNVGPKRVYYIPEEQEDRRLMLVDNNLPLTQFVEVPL